MGALETEVLGIKATLVGQDRKLDKLFDVIRETQQRTGPGLKEVLGLCAIGGGVISFIAAAITVLVVSIVQPAQTRRPGNYSPRMTRADHAPAASAAGVARASRMAARALRPLRRPVSTMEQRAA